MVSVKYSQIRGIIKVCDQWWSVKGLPFALLQKVEAAISVVLTNSATMEKMKTKLVDENVLRDGDGNPVVILKADGTPAIAIDENGEQTTLPDFGPNKATVDAEWERIMELAFDCPSIPAQMLDENAEKLGLTLGTMRMIKPLVAQE